MIEMMAEQQRDKETTQSKKAVVMDLNFKDRMKRMVNT